MMGKMRMFWLVTMIFLMGIACAVWKAFDVTEGLRIFYCGYTLVYCVLGAYVLPTLYHVSKETP